MERETNISELIEGALQERFAIELQKVWDNLLDPNTDPKKARKLTMTMVFKTNDKREITTSDVEVKTTLAPAAKLSTMFLMDRDSRGGATAREFAQGKLFDEKEAPAEVETTNRKVSYLEQKQAGRV